MITSSFNIYYCSKITLAYFSGNTTILLNQTHTTFGSFSSILSYFQRSKHVFFYFPFSLLLCPVYWPIKWIFHSKTYIVMLFSFQSYLDHSLSSYIYHNPLPKKRHAHIVCVPFIWICNLILSYPFSSPYILRERPLVSSSYLTGHPPCIILFFFILLPLSPF